MYVLRSAPDKKTERENLLQPVLLSFGDGSGACGGNLRMVRGGIYRRQRPGAEILQPELCHSGPIYAESAARESAYQSWGSGRMAAETDRSGAGQRSRETREAGPAGVRDHQHVHGLGWSDGDHSIPLEA